MEGDFGVAEGHDGVACVGPLVADEDEAPDERQEAFEVDAVHAAALHALVPEVGDVAAEDAFGFEAVICLKASALMTSGSPWKYKGITFGTSPVFKM